MKKILLFAAIALASFSSVQAKIWRVNNNVGVVADFTDVATCVNNGLVANGDTVHIEPSATSYGGWTLNKSLIFIGNGYFLSGAAGNSGLQENTQNSVIYGHIILNTGSTGSRFYGLYIYGYQPYIQSGYSGNINVLFEKCLFDGTYMMGTYENATYSNISFRKCFFNGNANWYISGIPTYTNITIENCIVGGAVILNPDVSSNNITLRNCTVGYYVNVTKCYVANNIINSGGNTFNNCVVSNNIFTGAQSGVPIGPLNVNGNNLQSVPWADLLTLTGSTDAQYQLKAGSPAIGGGVLIAGTKPDCGAFGGPNPYKLSGIPGIPTIYNLSVPSSIPVGTPSMNATISTRNNN